MTVYQIRKGYVWYDLFNKRLAGHIEILMQHACCAGNAHDTALAEL
jgi:hypothetical protein